MTSTKRYECVRCGKQHTADSMVFSTYSRKRYCADLEACSKRAKRRGRAAA